MNEVSIQFFTNSKVRRYLDKVVETGFYGQTVAEAVERIVAGTLEDMVVNSQIEEIEGIAE
jgi:hypothetical protein